jgi:hypothetical protein
MLSSTTGDSHGKRNRLHENRLFQQTQFFLGKPSRPDFSSETKELSRPHFGTFLGKEFSPLKASEALGPIQFRWDHTGTKITSFAALFQLISGVRTTESS